MMVWLGRSPGQTFFAEPRKKSRVSCEYRGTFWFLCRNFRPRVTGVIAQHFCSIVGVVASPRRCW